MNQKKTLAIDIGGSHIKGTILDTEGRELASYESVKTPANHTPKSLLKAIEDLKKNMEDYDQIAVGFPGYIKKGIVLTAPNLDTKKWKGFKLENEISKALGKPTRLLNDADMQGLGIASGKGFEIVLTLGTGFGSAFLLNGQLMPHLELAHHPLTKKKDYDDYLGEKALLKKGIKKWNKRIKKIIKILKKVFHYDTLYIGGGNARHINVKLKKNIRLVSNEDGIKGGSKVWE
ncbi:MAG: ROK family protein [Saprospiraceae bacterium]|nr:ROK family protein [Saprospiraceae bacterium]